MRKSTLIAVTAVAMLLLAAAVVVNIADAQPPVGEKLPPKAEVAKNPAGFIPLPTMPNDELVQVDPQADTDLAFLKDPKRAVKVRHIKNGVPHPYYYPIYVIKDVTVMPAKVAEDGRTSKAVVNVDVRDILENKMVREQVCGKVDYRIVSPEGNSVRVGLFVTLPEAQGQRVLLGETGFTRADLNVLHPIQFSIESDKSFHLLHKSKGQFSLEFSEDYMGLFTEVDIIASSRDSSKVIQSVVNTIRRTFQPDQKVGKVAFGGGVAQDNGLRKQIAFGTELEVYTRKGASIDPKLLDFFLNELVKPVLVQQRITFDPKKDADEMFTYFLQNGMSVQGSIGTFTKVEGKDRFELEKLLESSKSWDKSLEIFTKLGFKVDTPLGLGGNYSGDVEFRMNKKDIGAEANKDYSKDVKEMFAMAEGKLPVVALDVEQLLKADADMAKAIGLKLGTFTTGRKTLTYSVSLNTLPDADRKLPEYQSDLEKKFVRLTAAEVKLTAQATLLVTQAAEITELKTLINDKAKYGVGSLTFISISTNIAGDGFTPDKGANIKEQIPGKDLVTIDLSKYIPADKEVVVAFPTQWETDRGKGRWDLISVGSDGPRHLSLQVSKGSGTGATYGFGTGMILRPKGVVKN